MATPANKPKPAIPANKTNKNATDSKKPGSVRVPLAGDWVMKENRKNVAQAKLSKKNKETRAFNSAKAELRAGGEGLKKLESTNQWGAGTWSREAALKNKIAQMEVKNPGTYKSVKGGTPPASKAAPQKPAKGVVVPASKQTPEKGKVVEAKTNPTKTPPAKGKVVEAKTNPTKTPPAKGGAVPPKPGKTTPKASSYDTANKNGAMDKLVATRNSSSKGSREYTNAQNSINQAMGSKVRHKAKNIEPVSTIKSSGVVATKEFKKPPVSTTPEAVQLPSKKGESAVTKKEKGFFGKKSAMKSVAKKIKR
tara:strand:- start:4835 stop:5758 length:924 start_codon:yes stop_codon:yes gene_type:complete